MNIRPIHTRIFREGENIGTFITAHVKKIPEKSVLVVTSKIIALAEKRSVPAGSEKEKERLIRAESEYAIRTEHAWLTIKEGAVIASAGIDESNANGRWILLPKDSFKAARVLRTKLQKIYHVKNLGVIISDSRLLPLRAGVVGVALGYAGFRGLRDYRGTPDIFGRTLKLSQTDVADSLATAAVLLMGEGKEQQPLALITGAPITFSNTVRRGELMISIQDDLYRPLFLKTKK